MNEQTLMNILDFPLMVNSNGNGIFREELIEDSQSKLFKGETQDWTFSATKKSYLQEQVDKKIHENEFKNLIQEAMVFVGVPAGLMTGLSLVCSLPMSLPVVSTLSSILIIAGGYMHAKHQDKKKLVLIDLFEKGSCTQIRNKNSGKGIHFRYDEKKDKLVVQVRDTGKDIFQKSYTREEFKQDFMEKFPTLIDTLSLSKALDRQFLKDNKFEQRPLAELFTQKQR